MGNAKSEFIAHSPSGRSLVKELKSDELSRKFVHECRYCRLYYVEPGYGASRREPPLHEVVEDYLQHHHLHGAHRLFNSYTLTPQDHQALEGLRICNVCRQVCLGQILNSLRQHHKVISRHDPFLQENRITQLLGKPPRAI